MRILMVGHYPPHGGGVARHLDNLVRELRKRHEVHVLTYGPVEPRDFEKDLVHQVRVPPVYGLRGTSFAFLGARKIVELHRRFGFDIIHAHFVGTTSFAGVLAKERLNLPLVVTAHGSDLEHTAKLTLGRLYVRKSLERADAVITVSQYLAKLAQRLGAKNVRVIPNGVEGLEEIPAERRYITFIGALREYKSPETFIELARHFPGEEFLVVGDGPLRKELEEKAPGNVRFLGYRRDVDKILSESRLLVLPSRREGFGLVILEANSLGVPAVGRRVSAIPELIREGKNGLTFESFDELVEAVRTLLEPKVNRKAGAIGRRVARFYSGKKVAIEVEALYESLTG
ncbi:glycosyltransferase family 4 protein [Thermococcus nautili]|uniref:Glycosyltransferase n=1 Tax=Thermococcus nautili TaxID=195522 RepID=W8NT61_9EURY|nr:glycosyltransferase family 4 protein [Thermococcus nautili]AHL22438.1 Glycosyltransferase [Thermococcus nautili]CAI1493515.1 Glycosyltransferase [Thermococcus nautili]